MKNNYMLKTDIEQILRSRKLPFNLNLFDTKEINQADDFINNFKLLLNLNYSWIISNSARIEYCTNLKDDYKIIFIVHLKLNSDIPIFYCFDICNKNNLVWHTASATISQLLDYINDFIEG